MKNWKVGKTHANTTVIIYSEPNNVHTYTFHQLSFHRLDKEDNKKLSIPQHHLGDISCKAKRNRESHEN